VTRRDPAPPSVLTRLPWLLALESLVLVVLLYPLYFRQDWLREWVGAWEARASGSRLARLALTEIEPIITFHFSPLILKGAAAAACLTAFLGVLIAGRFLRSFAPGSLPDWRARREGAPATAFALWLILIGWLALSAAWSPTRRLSLAALPWLLAFGLFGYALLRRGIRVGEARQLAVLLMGLGTLVSLITILQATGLFGGAIFSFMHRFDDPRNAYGSLMGHNTAVGNFLLMTLFPAIAIAAGGGGRWARVGTCAYIAVALLGMILAQSRAVWIIAPPLLAVYVVFSGSLTPTAVRRVGGLLVALLALTILSQAIPVSDGIRFMCVTVPSRNAFAT
jgi:hypothetical protein